MKIPLWILFLGFSAIVGIFSSLAVLYIATHTSHGLVREDYYQAGLHLDEQRQREARFDSLHIQLNLSEKTDSLVLELPKGESVDSSVLKRLDAYTLELFLQRPDDPSEDRQLVLQNDIGDGSGSILRWSISTPNLKKGQWNCRIVFEDQGRPRMEKSFTYNTGE